MINPIRERSQRFYVSLALLLVMGLISDQVRAQEPSSKQLDAVIATLRNIQSDKLSEVQKETKGKEIEKS